MAKLTMTAFWGVPAYTWKGAWAEIKKHMGASVENYIIASRIAQGYDEIKTSTLEEREDVVRRWKLLQQPKKNKWWQSKDPAVKQAIKDSVSATSTGNPGQNARIQQAIESSIDQIHQASIEGKDDEALERAIQASIQEASSTTGRYNDEDLQMQISLAMQRSLDGPSPGDDSDKDTNIKEALRQTKIDNDLDEAMKRSLQDTKPEDEEERIVMEYVKKQSLLEEQHRRNTER